MTRDDLDKYTYRPSNKDPLQMCNVSRRCLRRDKMSRPQQDARRKRRRGLSFPRSKSILKLHTILAVLAQCPGMRNTSLIIEIYSKCVFAFAR